MRHDQRLWGSHHAEHRAGIRFPYPVQPRPQANVASGRLDLKPGELVRVRSKAEIGQTLNPTGKKRGLWFDREMLPFCGQTHTVTRRVERFIDESSGEMIERLGVLTRPA